LFPPFPLILLAPELAAWQQYKKLSQVKDAIQVLQKNSHCLVLLFTVDQLVVHAQYVHQLVDVATSWLHDIH